MGDASEALTRLGRITDTSLAEVQKARQAWADAITATAPAKAMCDILAAVRIEDTFMPIGFTRWEEKRGTVVGDKDHLHALEVLEGMHQLHFPVTFPEVFLRERAGFDVILGNPPWEEATIEKDAFWARHFPGLRALVQREQEVRKAELRDERPDLYEQYKAELMEAESTRRFLIRGPFPGMGTGDPDLYKAFCWRFWSLCTKKNGRIGVVLPRSALAAKGSEMFRFMVFEKAKSFGDPNPQ